MSMVKASEIIICKLFIKVKSYFLIWVPNDFTKSGKFCYDVFYGTFWWLNTVSGFLCSNGS